MHSQLIEILARFVIINYKYFNYSYLGVRAAQFIGQASSKSTNGKSNQVEIKGQSQREQEETIRKFKSGDINVLVATCIAEEGFDIGNVDLIICFDSVASPIRMIQRIGRTGRQNEGKVIMLMQEGLSM